MATLAKQNTRTPIISTHMTARLVTANSHDPFNLHAHFISWRFDHEMALRSGRKKKSSRKAAPSSGRKRNERWIHAIFVVRLQLRLVNILREILGETL